MNNVESKIITRYNELKAIRSNYENTLQDISDYVLINRGNFNRDTLKNAPETNKVFCGYAIEASHRLASVVYNGLFNPGSKWFQLRFKKIDENNVEFKRWLDEASLHLLDVFNSTYSNFSTANYEVLLSWNTLGTSCMYAEEDKEGTIKFLNIHLSEIYFASNTYGELDTVMRVTKMKPLNIINRFGIENVHSGIVKAVDTNPDEDIDVLHYVRPKDSFTLHDVRNPAKLKNFNYISTYIDLKHAFMMSEGGYYKQPYIISRFSVFTSDDWGRSPAWDCLNEVKMLNRIHKDTMRTIQLKSTPPILTTADALQEGMELAPGMILDGTLSFDGTPNIIPLNVGGDIQDANYLIDKTILRIRESFYVDQLYYKDGTPATATQIQDQQLTRQAMLAPIINRLQHEHLNKLIEIVFDIEYRSGRIRKSPVDLTAKELRAEYLTPLANQQKLEDISAIQRYFQFMAPMLQVDPTALDAIKLSETGLYSALSFGLPGKLIRSPTEMAKLLADRQQQAAEAQQNEQMAAYANQLSKLPQV